MATKTSIWFDGDEYRWNDKYNDYVCRKIVDGQIVETQYQLARERRFRADRLAKDAEEQENETETPKYSRRLGREMHGLTVLYLKTGDNRYADAAYRLMKQNDETGEKVEYAAQGYGGQTQGAQGYGGGSNKNSVWFEGYEYEFDPKMGDYVRWAYLGGKSRPFTLRNAQKKALKEAKKVARAEKKQAKANIREKERELKETETFSWSRTSSTKFKASNFDLYTCASHGNDLKKSWAEWATVVSQMKENGFSQHRIDKFVNMAVEKSVETFRSAYKYHGGIEALVATMKGYSPYHAKALYSQYLEHLSPDDSENEANLERLVRDIYMFEAKEIAYQANPKSCRNIASYLSSYYNEGLKEEGYLDLSESQDNSAIADAFRNWLEINKKEKKDARQGTEPQDEADRNDEQSEAAKSPVERNDENREELDDGTGSEPEKTDGGSDARGTSGGETSVERHNDTGDRPRDSEEQKVTIESQTEPPKEASQSAFASKMSNFVAAAMERKRDEEARNKSEATRKSAKGIFSELKKRRNNPPTEPPKIIEEPVADVQEPKEPGLTPGVPEKVDYNQVYEVPIDHLKVDPKRFQFKLGGDAESGASNLYSGAQFDLKLSNTIMVWRDPDDGNDYVVNGHHRMNIAKKSGYTGNMRVVYCDAKTANDAKVEGAIFNIADGKGSEIDVADVMRNCPDWENRPKVRQFISKNNKLAENGRALAGLSDKIYAEVKNGLLDWKLAAPIGKILAMGSLQGADEAQNQTYKIAFGTDGKKKKKTSADEVRRIAQEVLETNPIKNNDTMGFLFDNAADENDWQSVVQEATKMSKEVESFFSDEKKVNNFASKSKNTNKLNKSGVLKGETDAELAKKYADAAKTILDAFTNSNAEKYTTYRNIYINAKEKYRDFIEQNPQDEKGRKKKRETLVAEIIGKFFDVYNDGLPKEKRVANPMAAQQTQTEEEPQPETPKVEPPKPQKSEPPKTEEPQPAEPSKPVEPPKPAPKPKAKESTKPPKKPKEPKPKPAPKKKEEPKVVIDPKYRNAGNNLDDEDKALLRFIKKFIGDGKITNLDSFLKDAARALSTKQEEVAPSFCRDIIDELVEKNYVDKDGENSYSLTERGHAAIYNFDKKKTANK